MPAKSCKSLCKSVCKVCKWGTGVKRMLEITFPGHTPIHAECMTNRWPEQSCRHLKKFFCKGTLRQVFIRVYGLETQSVCWYFRPSFVNCCSSPLLSGSTIPPPPLPCVNKYIVCKGGGDVWGSGSQTDKHLPQSPFTAHLF